MRLTTILLLIAAIAVGTAARGQTYQSLRPEGARPEVAGIEQGDNGFRHKTPALNRALVQKQYVNVERLHEHKRALFGSSPGQVTDATMHDVATTAPPPVPMARKAKSTPAHGDPWPWIGGIVAVMAVMLLVLVRATGRTPVTKAADRFVITSCT